MKKSRNLNSLAAEICYREETSARQVNITEVKRVLRHLADIMAEDWQYKYDLHAAEALRRNGLGRLRKKLRPRNPKDGSS